jgi:hypothetical protein
MAAPVLHLVSEHERLSDVLAVHARIWEPATRALLDDLDFGAGASVLRVGAPPDAGPPADGCFDLVHARFQLALRGDAEAQLDACRQLVRPGGVLLVEEPDMRSLVYDPYAPAATHLAGRVAQVMKASGRDLDAGRRVPAQLRRAGLAPRVRTHVLGLEAGHPHLRLPLDLADVYAQRLADVLGRDALAQLRRQAAAELDDPARGGTALTLVQAWVRF